MFDEIGLVHLTLFIFTHNDALLYTEKDIGDNGGRGTRLSGGGGYRC